MSAGWFSARLPEPSEIIVPFPIESEASGIHSTEPSAVVWYQREFEVPEAWDGRIVLRIGACDHWARVFINGQEVGQHRGGYAPFSFDIQHALVAGTNSLTFRVQDSLAWTQPRGKQAGTTRWPIDYDSVTGIWQTVWLEPLPAVSIESTACKFLHATGELTFTSCFSAQVEGTLTAEISCNGTPVAKTSVETGFRSEVRLDFTIKDADLWSPDSPHLYDIHLNLFDRAHSENDEVSSYLALREIDVESGELRLNGEKLFLRGVLDQGYFPGGWYAPLTDDDIRSDVELTLAMGFNCARKHQKAEDPRYLYWADKLGLMIWAEMPSGKIFSTELIETLTHEWMDLVKRDRAHPSIIAWVPFNESWGVWHQSSRPEQRSLVDGIVSLTKALDQSRPVIGNDGWEYSSGDLWTLHLYQAGDDLAGKLAELIDNPGRSVTSEQDGHKRAGALPGADVQGLPILLTECGGVGFGQYGADDFSYGDLPQTEAALEERIRRTAELISSAEVLQGFVWTQLTDVQQEINGLLYFDRRPKLALEVLNDIFSSIGKNDPDQIKDAT